MIITRAPMRISFMGGGTDMPDFYKKYPGRVISSAIDNYIYIVLNKTPLVNKVSARYSISETVDHPKDLQHTRIKEALLDFGITNNLEIGSFASLPAKTGLGSSSSFSVALLKGLYECVGKKTDRREIAEAACRLEIDLLKEPIGKQDQYAAAFGGLNVFQFNADGSVDVEPVLIDYKKSIGLQDHISIFFTGITRDASSVLSGQKANVSKNFETLKEMSDSVLKFRDNLMVGDFEKLGDMLNDGWKKKKTLASNVSNGIIDELYDAGMNAGAWGGKLLGAGGGGCVMFLSPLDKKEAIEKMMFQIAEEKQLKDFSKIPVNFVNSGVEIVYSADFKKYK
jgi:D-glycero-alpha-D-manno-heptose-7-phosphate kinase